jgi:hypothetical protein
MRVTSTPAIWMLPALGSTSRLSIFKVVVLPEPEPPTRARSSQRST